MENKVGTLLDGSKEERERVMREFFGLSDGQTYQDIEVYDDEEDD